MGAIQIKKKKTSFSRLTNSVLEFVQINLYIFIFILIHCKQLFKELPKTKTPLMRTNISFSKVFNRYQFLPPNNVFGEFYANTSCCITCLPSFFFKRFEIMRSLVCGNTCRYTVGITRVGISILQFTFIEIITLRPGTFSCLCISPIILPETGKHGT